jgi:hypothetical protein
VVETMFASPKAIAELQSKIADLGFEAAEESARRAEETFRQMTAASIEQIRAQSERVLEAMAQASRTRAKATALLREAMKVPAAPATK